MSADKAPLPSKPLARARIFAGATPSVQLSNAHGMSAIDRLSVGHWRIVTVERYDRPVVITQAERNERVHRFTGCRWDADHRTFYVDTWITEKGRDGSVMTDCDFLVSIGEMVGPLPLHGWPG